MSEAQLRELINEVLNAKEITMDNKVDMISRLYKRITLKEKDWKAQLSNNTKPSGIFKE
jgi:hypothetical protein